MPRKNLVGIVDFNEDDPEDEEPVQYCPSCFKSDRLSKLGPRSWRGQEPEDNELFCQCYFCGEIYGVHEIENQKKLQVVELKSHITDNPFEAKQTLTESIPKRTSPAGIKARKKRNRPHHKDEEIDREIQQHGIDNVNVIYDSDP